MGENQAIGVFGEEVLLWACLLRQSPRRPPAEHVYRHASYLLDELKVSPAAQALPVQSVEDGMFAIVALLDEIAMSLPDLRPLWSQGMLQARRFATNNAGVEVFSRLERVRRGPRSVLATYVVVLGCGFLGQYGLPGMNPYELNQLRAQLARALGVDADRDAMVGSLRPYGHDAVPEEAIPKEPWYRSIWLGRGLAGALLLVGGVWLGQSIFAMLGGGK